MSLSDEMKRRALQLLSDPRVSKLLQNEQFVRAMTALVQVPDKVNDFTQDQSGRVAQSLKLATEAQLQKLEDRIEGLESEVRALRRKSDGEVG